MTQGLFINKQWRSESMKAKEKTAGKTALKTRNINTERIERWRRHVAKRIKELENFRKTKHGFEVHGDALEQLRMCANAEGMTMEDLVVKFLLTSRNNCEVRHERPSTHSKLYLEESRAYEDTFAEQHYTKRELACRDREIARDGVTHYNNSMPVCFKEFNADEKKSIVAFYRSGDWGLYNATLRALHYGLQMSSRLNRV